jgi:uncharacterized protein YndB with AHSA1/START domain
MKHPLGTVTKESDGFKVRFERVYNCDIKTLWDAITNPAKLKLWFTDIEMDLRPGGKMTIFFRDEARTATSGKVIQIKEPHLFEFMWENELARWELAPEGKAKTKLTLTYSKLEDGYAVSAPAGFHLLLDRLDSMLSGHAESYAFGTEENDPEQNRLQQEYENVVFPDYPDLKRIKPVVVERSFNASSEQIWNALTNKDQMKQWYFDIPEFKAIVGLEFTFAVEHEGTNWVHLCTVTDVKRNELIAYTWRYEGFAGNSHVKFEIIPDGKKTRLRITHSGLHTFPSDAKGLEKQNFQMGWSGFMDELEKFLNTKP